MLTGDRTLLRQHIEAVWGIQLPIINRSDVEVLREGPQPPWKLCTAELAGERVHIWRADVAMNEKGDLLTRVDEALVLPPTAETAPEISREVALRQIAIPSMPLENARQIARPLTVDDKGLVEAFEAGSVEYYFNPARRPLLGVVVEGRLLSIAHSSRRTTEACELGIETQPEARRQGYALAATVVWAASVAQEGLIPFYSALSSNVASLKLAEAAGYRVFARAANIRG